jgi:hypothetical protein
LDGSGKEGDHPVITIGGFLADADLCERIESDWEVATGGRVFHLAEFGTRRCALGSKDWEEAQTIDFLKRLASIVNRKGCYIISTSIEVAPYNEFLAKSPHAHVNGPAFSGCGQTCIALAEFLLAKDKRHRQKVAYVFEKGDREHELHKMVSEWSEISDSERSGLRSLAFQPKQTTLLQAADLIAGVVERVLVSAHSGLACFNNGLSRTALHNFEQHYSGDGITASVVSGHDHAHCWIMNPKTFSVLDRISTGFFAKHPEVLEKRLKQTPFKPSAARTPKSKEKVNETKEL